MTRRRTDICRRGQRRYDPAADTGADRAQLRVRRRAPRRPAAPLGRALRRPPGGRGAASSPTCAWTSPRSAPGLLHDCVEDTSATAEDIGRLFGTEIQFLVEGVTKLGQIPWTTREERQAENFRKMLLAMARDIRVILIKLADRVDNMRTLQHMPRDKQERIARETREIYAPLANRLGIQWMKVELEDLAFRYLEPEDYADLHRADGGDRGEPRERLHRRGRASKLRDGAGRGRASRRRCRGRAKHLWSIHQKMKKTGRDLEQIHDVIAFRVDHRVGARLLRGAGRRALELDAGAGALQGLHRAAQAEPLPVAAHHGDRAARRAHGGADPHAGDAPHRRAGHRRALALQGKEARSARPTARRSPGCAS